MTFTKHPPVVRGMYLTMKTGWARPPYPTLRIDLLGEGDRKPRRTTRTVNSDDQLYKAVQLGYRSRMEMGLKCDPENPRLAYQNLKAQLAVSLKEKDA